jgi:hypothetical protein
MPVSSKDLFQALHAKVGYEVVSFKETDAQLRIMGRIPGDPVSLNSNNWKILKWQLLKATQAGRPWAVDLSKSYFIKPETDRLVFAWRIILQGAGLADHYADVLNLIKTSPESSRTEVMEMPLAGAGADRNSTAGGRRGAGPAGSVLVGPMAVHAKRMGG